MPLYATIAQKARELISERTRVALAASRARGTAQGGDRGYRPSDGHDATRAAQARRVDAERAAHRLVLELERLQTDGVIGQAALARALNERGMAPPAGRRGARTHTAVARVLARATT